MNQSDLNKLFYKGVRAENSNCYIQLIGQIQDLNKQGRLYGNDRISINQLYKALQNNSEKWNKEIDKYLE